MMRTACLTLLLVGSADAFVPPIALSSRLGKFPVIAQVTARCTNFVVNEFTTKGRRASAVIMKSTTVEAMWYEQRSGVCGS